MRNSVHRSESEGQMSVRGKQKYKCLYFYFVCINYYYVILTVSSKHYSHSNLHVWIFPVPANSESIRSVTGTENGHTVCLPDPAVLMDGPLPDVAHERNTTNNPLRPAHDPSGQSILITQLYTMVYAILYSVSVEGRDGRGATHSPWVAGRTYLAHNEF